MPREVLPRLGHRNTMTPDKWPYLRQSTIDDISAMRYLRGQSASRYYGTLWQTLQQRLEQYATAGAGTVAEAIVTNDYWWTGQVAHEPPSGNRATAAHRRYNKTQIQ
jgi:hypothetical protein